MPPLQMSTIILLTLFISYKFRDYRVLYHIPGQDILLKTTPFSRLRKANELLPGQYRLPESFPFMISRFPW